MPKSKANIGTVEEPYFIEEGMLVHDMRTSEVRKVVRIIWDPDHRPEFCVFLEVSKADLTGNGRELSELRVVDATVCTQCGYDTGTLTQPCPKCEEEV